MFLAVQFTKEDLHMADKHMKYIQQWLWYDLLIFNVCGLGIVV